MDIWTRQKASQIINKKYFSVQKHTINEIYNTGNSSNNLSFLSLLFK